MDVVIDTSAIMAVITAEPTRAAILQATKGTTLRAPASVHWEIGNAFSALFKKRRITPAEASKAIGFYKHIPITFVDVRLEDAVEIAAHYRLYAYDAYILACARRFGAPVVSLDGTLLKTAQLMKLDIVDI